MPPMLPTRTGVAAADAAL